MPRSPKLHRPDFLVIGGMKCASTTLHEDLSGHPNIFCGKKELDALTEPGSRTVDEIYFDNFRTANDDQLLGDVSTSYAMLPNYPGIPGAAAALNDQMKIVYLVREPVSRAVSHHQHMNNWSGQGQMRPDINQAIHKHPQLIDLSRYAMQIDPWVKQFGLSQILLLRFEDYVGQRQQTVQQVCDFLDVPEVDLDLSAEGTNRSESRRYAGKLMFRVYQSSIFKRFIQPATPDFLRVQLRKVLLKQARQVQKPPTLATVDLIIDTLRDDLVRLQQMVGRKTPFWDMAAVRARYASAMDAADVSA